MREGRGKKGPIPLLYEKSTSEEKESPHQWKSFFSSQNQQERKYFSGYHMPAKVLLQEKGKRLIIKRGGLSYLEHKEEYGSGEERRESVSTEGVFIPMHKKTNSL